MWSEVNESCIVWKALVVVQEGTWYRMDKSRKSEKRGSRCPGGMAWPLASFLLLSPQSNSEIYGDTRREKFKVFLEYS